MNDAMRTFLAVSQDGTTIHVSAYTESEARQKAEDALGWGQLVKFEEI